VALLCVGLWLLANCGSASSQTFCFGDVNRDGKVTPADAVALEPLLFPAAADPDPSIDLRDDANGDGALTAADLVAVLMLSGMSCPAATPTPAGPTQTPASTRTPTPTLGPPTATFTATRTATPTPTCVIRAITPGTVDGELTAADCPRQLAGELRRVDVYEVVGVPGQAIRASVTATGSVDPLVAWIAVLDPENHFGRVEGLSPVEFVVQSTQPYLIQVGTRPGTSQMYGPYRLTVSVRPCPTPRTVNLTTGFALSNLQLSESLCPDPATGSSGGAPNPVHLYSINVSSTQIPAHIDIAMRQLRETDDIDPTFSLLNADKLEVVHPDQVDDNLGGVLGTDAGGRFLLLEAGTYTLVAQGGVGLYSMVITSPTCTSRRITNIPADRPVVCSGQPGPGCRGTLYGDRRRGTCGGPVPIPGVDDLPEIGAGADLYNFDVQAGEIVSVELSVAEDDAYLILLGPRTAGNPIVAFDNDGGPFSVGPDAQLAATLTQAGTYTLIVSNTSPLAPPDPEDATDPGDQFSYTMYLQKCLARGGLSLEPGRPLSGTFTVTDCYGFGGVPFRSYAFFGTAGSFVTAHMTGDEVLNPHLRLLGSDGSRVENDADPFDLFDLESPARVSRVLPVTGTYYLEAAGALEQGKVDPADNPSFVLTGAQCATRSISDGVTAVTLDANDCSLTNGRRYEVLTFAPTTVPAVASLSAGPELCIVGLLADGTQFPSGGCQAGSLDIPMTQAGTYAVMVAGQAASGVTTSSVTLRTCPLGTLGYGMRASLALSETSCIGADNFRSNWHLVRGVESIVRFNQGISGLIDSQFEPRNVQTDIFGPLDIGRVFGTDPVTMFRSGRHLQALLRVRAASPAERGPYSVAVDFAELRQ
jgi:hypothetical protein